MIPFGFQPPGKVWHFRNDNDHNSDLIEKTRARYSGLTIEI
jgi:hypothetical protein